MGVPVARVSIGCLQTKQGREVGMSITYAVCLGALMSVCAAAAAAPPLDAPWDGKLPATESHPCLFFGKEDLPRLRERVQREPYRSWLARGPAALRWAISGYEAAAAQARAELVDKPILREPGHGYIEPSSHHLYYAALHYDLLFDWPGLSADDHRVIRAKLAREAEYYWDTMNSVPGGCNFGNQRTLGASALGMCALVLADYEGSAHTPAEWLQRALSETRRPENWWFFRPDGSFVEGYGYTTYMCCLLEPFTVAYYRNTGRNLLDDPTLQAMLRWHAYFLLPDGLNPNLGTTVQDSGGASLYVPFVNRELGGDMVGLYAWAAQRLAPQWRIHPHLYTLALVWFDDSIQPAPEAFPPAAVFPTSEMMAMRSGWDDDLTGLWITGKDAGWQGRYYRTYSHADPTSFFFYSGKSFLVTDGGYPHWRNYRDGYGPEYHNLVLVDGQGPTQETLGDLRDAVMSPRANAGTVETSYGGVQVRRLFLMAEQRVALIGDFLTGEGPHEYLGQIHTALPEGGDGVTMGERTVSWPGMDMVAVKPTSVRAQADFAGPVQLERLPSHWLYNVEEQVANTAFGARWMSEGPTCQLWAVHATGPNEEPVTITTSQEGAIQRLTATTREWVITAQARPTPGLLVDGGARARAQCLVVCREAGPGGPGRARWLYVWGAQAMTLPGLPVDAAMALRRGLIVNGRAGWEVVPVAEGT